MAKDITVSPCFWKVVNLVRVLQEQSTPEAEGGWDDLQPKTTAGGGYEALG